MIALLLALAVPQTAVTQSSVPAQSPVTAPVSSVRLALGIEVGRLLNSREMTRSQLEQAFAKSMPQVLAKDPNYQLLEKAYPGITAATLDALKPVILQMVDQNIEALWQGLGRIYARSLSEAELRSTLTFYRSASGMWLIDRISAGLDPSAIFAKSLADPNVKLDGADIRGLVTPATTAGIIDGMTTERARDIVAFSRTAVGLKLRTLGPALTQEAADWGNKVNGLESRAAETVVIGAIQNYIAKADADRKKTAAPLSKTDT